MQICFYFKMSDIYSMFISYIISVYNNNWYYILQICALFDFLWDLSYLVWSPIKDINELRNFDWFANLDKVTSWSHHSESCAWHHTPKITYRTLFKLSKLHGSTWMDHCGSSFDGFLHWLLSRPQTNNYLLMANHNLNRAGSDSCMVNGNILALWARDSMVIWSTVDFYNFIP